MEIFGAHMEIFHPSLSRERFQGPPYGLSGAENQPYGDFFPGPAAGGPIWTFGPPTPPYGDSSGSRGYVSTFRQ